ncbi:MAG: response regulator transcription factor [Chloroflexi bacterium]|nr:response regulator transcription factor [Chloroflexota bacterium]
MTAIRTLLVDDHPIVREGLRRMTELAKDVEIVGEASNGKEAVVQAERLQPDVVLMDIKMPEMDGIEATRLLKERFPKVRVIVLTFSEDEFLDQATEAGAAAYLLKGVSKSELFQTIRAVMASNSVRETLLKQSLNGGCGNDHNQQIELPKNDRPGLSPIGVGERHSFLISGLEQMDHLGRKKWP